MKNFERALINLSAALRGIDVNSEVTIKFKSRSDLSRALHDLAEDVQLHYDFPGAALGQPAKFLGIRLTS